MTLIGCTRYVLCTLEAINANLTFAALMVLEGLEINVCRRPNCGLACLEAKSNNGPSIQAPPSPTDWNLA